MRHRTSTWRSAGFVRTDRDGKRVPPAKRRRGLLPPLHGAALLRNGWSGDDVGVRFRPDVPPKPEVARSGDEQRRAGAAGA